MVIQPIFVPQQDIRLLLLSLKSTMTRSSRGELAVLIRSHQDELLNRWRRQVRELPSARDLDVPTLNDHIPSLLEELADALDSGSDETIAEALRDGSPPEHGDQRFEDGFDVTEMVAEYNILRGCIHDLAQEHNVQLEGRTFHILNRVLDGAIGLAVQAYADLQARSVKGRRDEHLAFVAHDLRNPLTAISLATSVLELSNLAKEEHDQNAQMIKALKRNVAQLEALVAKVLEEAGGTEEEGGFTLQRRHFDLWPHIGSIVQDMRPMAEEARVELQNEVPVEMQVYGDATLLRRILQNLISNAITYAPGGKVILGARAVGDDGTAECWVTDNGRGVPAERLISIFNKGEGDTERPGSKGLGLAIVKTFVEAHGGKVWAENNPGPGATIRFTLAASSTANTKG